MFHNIVLMSVSVTSFILAMEVGVFIDPFMVCDGQNVVRALTFGSSEIMFDSSHNFRHHVIIMSVLRHH